MPVKYVQFNSLQKNRVTLVNRPCYLLHANVNVVYSFQFFLTFCLDLYILLQALMKTHAGIFSHCAEQLFIFILLKTNSVFYSHNCPQAHSCLSIISSHIYLPSLNVTDCLTEHQSRPGPWALEI